MTAVDSTTEALNKHVIEKGRGCPACRTEDFRVEYHPLICYNDRIHRPVHCLDCSTEWDEIYKLVGGEYHRHQEEEE